MFDFEKLEVYHKAKQFNLTVSTFINTNSLDKDERSQLKRAAFSIMLNIAEGSGRFTKPDKRNFYIIARGSCFECVAVFDFLKDCKQIEVDVYDSFYNSLEEISKMLFALLIQASVNAVHDRLPRRDSLVIVHYIAKSIITKTIVELSLSLSRAISSDNFSTSPEDWLKGIGKIQLAG
jgi:four helix bundle protein